MRQQNTSTGGSPLIAGALMLAVGFGLGLTGPSEPFLYSASITFFVWLMRVGGCVMLIAAGLYITRLGFAPVVDVVASVLIGIMMAIVGLIWLLNSDFDGLILLVLGVLFAQSGWASRLTCRPFQPSSEPNRPCQCGPEPTVAPPPSPSQSQPEGDETLSDGFLADLGRADESNRD